jgi:hypothetical protein
MGGKHVRRNTFGLVWDSDDEAAVRSVATGCLFEFEWFEGCAWLSYSLNSKVTDNRMKTYRHVPYVPHHFCTGQLLEGIYVVNLPHQSANQT